MKQAPLVEKELSLSALMLQLVVLISLMSRRYFTTNALSTLRFIFIVAVELPVSDVKVRLWPFSLQKTKNPSVLLGV